MERAWQREGDSWFYVGANAVYLAMVIPCWTDATIWQATDFRPVKPELIGQYSSIDDAKRAVEQSFQEQQ